MSRGYSGGTIVCACALAFFIGCMVQQLPVLPDVSSGFTKGTKKGFSIRRRASEVHTTEAKDVEVQSRQKFAGEGSQLQREPETVPRMGSENFPESGVSPGPPDILSFPDPQQLSPGSSVMEGKPLNKGKTAAGFDEATAPLLPAAFPAGESGTNFHITQPFQLISWYPRTYLFPNFIDDERCEHIVNITSDRLGPSGLAYREHDDPKDSVDVRTSSGTFMMREQDPAGVLAWVEEKTAALTGIPVGHGEPFNVLRYEFGQHYDSHYDVFDPAEYGPQKTQRIATVLYYLTDVEEGGETIFPFEGKTGMDRLRTVNYRACEGGYQYKPRKGDALLFWSIHPNGTFDKHALHGGCPVKKGMKMVMTKWLRDNCQIHC